MAKAQTNASTDIAKGIAANAPRQIDPIVAGLQNQQGLNQQQANQDYGSARGVLQRGADTGYYDPTQLATLRGTAASQTATGGYDPTQLSNLRSDLTSAGATGGFDPARLSALQGRGDTYAETGGFDPTTFAKITGGYQSLADTGGYTPDQEAAFKREATAGVGSIYDTLAQQALINRGSTGGLGTGGDISQMARQLSQQQSTAATGANVALNERETANKLAGLGGLSSTQGQLAANRLSSQGQQIGLGSDVASGTRDILGQRSSLESGVASGARQGLQTQAGIEQNVAEGVKNAGQGFSQLFDANNNQITQLGKQMLDALGLSYQSQSQAAQILAQLSKNPGLFQTAFGDIIAAGQAAAGAAGGLGVHV